MDKEFIKNRVLSAKGNLDGHYCPICIRSFDRYDKLYKHMLWHFADSLEICEVKRENYNKEVTNFIIIQNIINNYFDGKGRYKYGKHKTK